MTGRHAYKNASYDEDVRKWPLTSFTVLQKCGRYRINSGQTAPSGLTGSAAFDPTATSASFIR